MLYPCSSDKRKQITGAFRNCKFFWGNILQQDCFRSTCTMHQQPRKILCTLESFSMIEQCPLYTNYRSKGKWFMQRSDKLLHEQYFYVQKLKMTFISMNKWAPARLYYTHESPKVKERPFRSCQSDARYMYVLMFTD